MLRSACRWTMANPGCLITIVLRTRGLAKVEAQKLMAAYCTKWYGNCTHFKGFKELIREEKV